MLVKNEEKSFDLQPTTFEEAMKYAQLIANSNLVPKDYKGKPEDVLIAIQMGKEVGLKPLQALQNIATINGRPCMWGDAMLAVVKAHRDFEYINEYHENDTAICAVKRKNEPEHTAKFSVQDAKQAGLLGKQGPWTQYPQRMLQMRARGFALRNTFPDALKGIISREEAQDYPQEKVINNKAEQLKQRILPKVESKPIEHETLALSFDELQKSIMHANSLPELKEVSQKIKDSNHSDEELEKLRDYYSIRKEEIKEAEKV